MSPYRNIVEFQINSNRNHL